MTNQPHSKRPDAADEPPTRALRADELRAQLRRDRLLDVDTGARTRIHVRAALREPSVTEHELTPRLAAPSDATRPALALGPLVASPALDADATRTSFDVSAFRVESPRLGAAHSTTAPIAYEPPSGPPAPSRRPVQRLLVVALVLCACTFMAVRAFRRRAAHVPSASPAAVAAAPAIPPSPLPSMPPSAAPAVPPGPPAPMPSMVARPARPSMAPTASPNLPTPLPAVPLPGESPATMPPDAWRARPLVPSTVRAHAASAPVRGPAPPSPAPARAAPAPPPSPRHALDLLLSGRIRDARDAYRALAHADPAQPAYARIVQLLDRSLACVEAPCP